MTSDLNQQSLDEHWLQQQSKTSTLSLLNPPGLIPELAGILGSLMCAVETMRAKLKIGPC